MSLSANRREVIAGAGAAAVVAPMLRPTAAQAQDPQLLAPIITVMDHRTCARPAKKTEYQGERTGGPDDQMCVKVVMGKVNISDKKASDVLQQVLGDLKRQ